MFSNFLVSLVAFLFTLGLVVIVHELGHFLFCKMFGVYVKTFSIGIGPKLLRKRWGETEYALSAIPFGGYVKMAGEGIMEEIQDAGTWDGRKYPLGTEEGNAEVAALEQHIPPDRHFIVKPAWQRLLVFIAGPAFNLILAFVLYCAIFMTVGEGRLPVTRVGSVDENSIGAEAGFVVGDRILAVDGQEVAFWDEVLEGLFLPSLDSPDEPVPISVDVERDGISRTLVFTPAFDEEGALVPSGLGAWDTDVGLVQKNGPADRAGLRTGDTIMALDDRQVTTFGGIAEVINASGGQEVKVTLLRDGQTIETMVQVELAEIMPDSSIGRMFIEPLIVSEKVSLSRAISRGWRETGNRIAVTFSTVRSLVTGDIGIKAVAGPIRIGSMTGEMLRWSFIHLVNFIAYFSVNLFVLNLLPIPVLDGGHVLFLLVEVVIRRKVPERIQAITTQLGMIALLLFMCLIVVLDMLRAIGS